MSNKSLLDKILDIAMNVMTLPFIIFVNVATGVIFFAKNTIWILIDLILGLWPDE